MKLLLQSIVFGALLAAAPSRVPAEIPAPAEPGAPAAATLPERLVEGATASGERLLSLEALRLFYGERGHSQAWRRNGDLSPQIDDLLSALRAADREGLHPSDYHLRAVESILARLRPVSRATVRAANEVTSSDPLDLDLLLSDAFFLYAAHLTAGRINPESLEPEWNIPGRARNLVLLLGSALDRGHLAATIRDLPPAREDYRLLRDALASQRAIAADGGWPLVPWGKALRPGDRGPRVAALRRRLAATGELPPGDDTTDELFGAPLSAALQRFQARHGLDADAVAGRRTLAELNTPAILRARQIEANLERLRWLPRELSPRRLVVNVADFRLELTEAGAPTLAMRIIAGRQARRTPFFSGEITSILFNPSWTVPEKIAIEDKLPLILDDPDYLEDQGFRVFAHEASSWREVEPSSVDWTSLGKTHFPYRLRQDPGPKNALGRVKFQIPNEHDIYLHDTPSHRLFSRTERTFSSGCIRVERAVDLAERLLGAKPAWTRARIEKTIEAGATVSVPLLAPLPVYLLYWTAWVDREGALQFREDVYGSDAAILEALSQPLAGR